jgi:ubiquinone/menaquinone biosynthesis C-methylase UbiE
MIPLNSRQRQAEWMDRAAVPEAELRRALRFIRAVNLLLGYTRATLNHLERFSRRWSPGQRIDIIDLATGSADIPRAILRWAEVRGFDVHIVGVDRHPVTARAARDCLAARDPQHFQIVQADVFDLPFAPLSFDYALCSMFLHHLDEAEAVRVMRTMGQLARRGVIIADLLRSGRAYRWIQLFTLLASPMIKHDSRASVAQAFTREEIMSLRDSAGLRFAHYREHFGHRFVLSGDKAMTEGCC